MNNLPEEKHDHQTLHFPDGFLWGSGTSSFQVEGNIQNSEWWNWEMKYQKEEFRSGIAADHYNRYEEDFKIAEDLKHNAHRLSLEWSRIEPHEREFDTAEIEHYRKVLQSLKSKNIKVMLTLHHFSNPQWFAQKGGWASRHAAKRFERFVKRIIPEYKDLVDYWITINEPTTYTSYAYYTREFPPSERNIWKLWWAYWNMAQAHKKAYKAIHKAVPTAQVGMTTAAQSFKHFHWHSLLEAFVVWAGDLTSNHSFYILTGKKYHDFIGLNYYLNRYISINGRWVIPNLLDISPAKKDASDLGWEIYPEGMFDMLLDFNSYHKPIIITENGIASTNDDRRSRFLISYLKEIYHAISIGVDVRGYFYWSFMDNMELHRGFTPRFGLIEIDYETQRRRVRDSARVYAEIIKRNGIPHDLLAFIGHTIQAKKILREGIHED